MNPPRDPPHGSPHRPRGRRWVRWLARTGWAAVAAPVFFHAVLHAAAEFDARDRAARVAAREAGGTLRDHDPPPRSAASALFARLPADGPWDRFARTPWATAAAPRELDLYFYQTPTYPTDDALRTALSAAAAVPTVTDLTTRGTLTARSAAPIARLPALRTWHIGPWPTGRAPLSDDAALPELRAAAQVGTLRTLHLTGLPLGPRHLAALAELRQVTTVILRDVSGLTGPEVRAAMPWAVVADHRPGYFKPPR